MERALRLHRGHRFLGGRGLARDLRVEVERMLADGEAGAVVLDFAGIEGVSHSFADELLSPLSESLHETVAHRVLIVNCSDDVLEELELVALMHGLFMPGARCDDLGGETGR